MKNKSKLSKEETLNAAQELLFSGLQILNFKIITLKKFFDHVRKVQENHKKILETIESGYSTKWESCIVGEIGDYYVVSNKKLDRCLEAGKRESLMIKTNFMGTILSDVTSMDKFKKFAEVHEEISTSIINAKRLAKVRRAILLGSVIIMNFGDELKQKHADHFKSEIVPYWRKALEVLRVELHLKSLPIYNDEIRQVDLFLRILEGVSVEGMFKE